MNIHYKRFIKNLRVFLGVSMAIALGFYLSTAVSTAEEESPFSVGDSIKTTANVNVRGYPPGIDGEIWGSQVAGSTGTIIGGPIFADDYIWWNVNYLYAPDGWSAETYFQKSTSTPTPTPTSTLSVGDSIKTTAKVDVRGNPGLNYQIWGSQGSGSNGKITRGPVYANATSNIYTFRRRFNKNYRKSRCSR